MKPLLMTLLAAVFCLSLPAFARETPKACHDAWLAAKTAQTSSYKQCIESVDHYYWWLNVADCLDKLKKSGFYSDKTLWDEHHIYIEDTPEDRCGALASYDNEYKASESEQKARTAHCSTLKPTTKMIQNHYLLLLEERALSKTCPRLIRD